MIVAISGENKTGKSTFSLTFPRKLYHVELDIGGFKRAIDSPYGVKLFSGDIKAKKIVSASYPMPQQYTMDRIMGRITLGKLKVEQPKRLTGIKELWYKLLGDLVAILETKSYTTVVIDSFPQLWELCRLAFLQEKQEIQFIPNTQQLKPGEKLRESLQPEEYVEPNARMRSLLYAFRQQGINLVIVEYMDDKYEKKLVGDKVEELITGRKMAGWNTTNITKEVDLLLENTLVMSNHSRTESPHYTVRTTVKLSGIGLDLMGQSFSEPSYDDIMRAKEMLT